MKKKFSYVVLIVVVVYCITVGIDAKAGLNPNWNGELSWFSSVTGFFSFILFIILTFAVYWKEIRG